MNKYALFLIPNGMVLPGSPDSVRAGDSSYRPVKCTDSTEEEGAAKKQLRSGGSQPGKDVFHDSWLRKLIYNIYI